MVRSVLFILALVEIRIQWMNALSIDVNILIFNTSYYPFVSLCVHCKTEFSPKKMQIFLEQASAFSTKMIAILHWKQMGRVMY